MIASSIGVIRRQMETDYIRCQYDFCFGTGGEIVDPTSMELLGRFAFDIGSTEFNWPRFVLPDLDRGLIYFLLKPREGMYLEAWDPVTQHRVAQLRLETAAQPTGLDLWGSGQFVVATEEEIFLFPMGLLHHRDRLSEPITNLVPAEKLVFPVLWKDESSFTGHAVTNLTGDPANLKLSAYILDGDSYAYKRSPVGVEVGSDEQWARMGAEIFDEPGIHLSWMELASSQPGMKGFFLYRDGEGMDGAVAEESGARVLYFPKAAIGEGVFRGKTALNYLFLVNPHGFQIEATIRLVDQGFSPPYRDRRVVTIPAKGLAYFELGQLFIHISKYEDAYLQVEVTSERGNVVGFQLAKVQDPETTVGFSGILPSEETTFYSAQLASGPGIFTSVKVLNTSTEDRTLQLQAIGESGQILAGPIELQLGPGEAMEQDASELFGFDDTRLTVGSLEIKGSGPGLVGNVLFGDSSKLEYASALPLETQPFRKAVFSHIANLADFFTGVALYNPSAEPASIRLSTFSRKGVETGSTSFLLPPGHRMSRLLTELVPTSAGQSDGYVLIESTEPLVGQQLFGTSALTLLAAVPPQVLE